MNARAFLVNLLRIFLVVITTTFAFSPAFAQIQNDKTLAPYFVVQGDPKIDQLPLKDTRVNIAVSGVIADVQVLQTYRNEGSRPINASYVFPASMRAAVYAMRMKIGDQVIVARIKEKQGAKQEFDEALWCLGCNQSIQFSFCHLSGNEYSSNCYWQHGSSKTCK